MLYSAFSCHFMHSLIIFILYFYHLRVYIATDEDQYRNVCTSGTLNLVWLRLIDSLLVDTTAGGLLFLEGIARYWHQYHRTAL